MRKLMIIGAAFATMQFSPAFAATADVMDRAKRAFAEQLALACLSDTKSDWLAKDAVYQYPLNDINVKLRVEGRDAVTAHLCAVSAIARETEVRNIRYFPTLDRHVVFVQYDLVPVDGRGKHRSPVAIIEMRGDQIAHFTQLNGSPESLQVLTGTARRVE